MIKKGISKCIENNGNKLINKNNNNISLCKNYSLLFEENINNSFEIVFNSYLFDNLRNIKSVKTSYNEFSSKNDNFHQVYQSFRGFPTFLREKNKGLKII